MKLSNLQSIISETTNFIQSHLNLIHYYVLNFSITATPPPYELFIHNCDDLGTDQSESINSPKGHDLLLVMKPFTTKDKQAKMARFGQDHCKTSMNKPWSWISKEVLALKLCCFSGENILIFDILKYKIVGQSGTSFI